jgi:hypothetical protein
MQKCPKCGYNEGTDWPGLLLMAAYGLVSVVAGIGGPRIVQLGCAGGSFLFFAAIIWRSAREDRNRVECLKLHPPDAERAKSS